MAEQVAAAAAAERPLALVLDPADNVAVVLVDLDAGAEVVLGGERIVLPGPVRFGHKIATAAIAEGESVYKYHEVIGIASADIALGAHVHVHNVNSARLPAPEAATA